MSRLDWSRAKREHTPTKSQHETKAFYQQIPEFDGRYYLEVYSGQVYYTAHVGDATQYLKVRHEYKQDEKLVYLYKDNKVYILKYLYGVELGVQENKISEYRVKENTSHDDTFVDLINDYEQKKQVLVDNCEQIQAETFESLINSFKLIKPISEWKTYRNLEYGFELKYPYECENPVISGRMDSTLAGIHLEKCTGFDINIFEKVTFDDARAKIFEEIKIGENTWTKILRGEVNESLSYAIQNDYGYEITFYGATTLGLLTAEQNQKIYAPYLDQILSTFKFIN